MIELMPHQKAALKKIKNGSILCGGVGSGKSLTALAYYKQQAYNCPIYIITTARKRDTLEWRNECDRMELFETQIVIDSWNNIDKYADVHDAFFIFDEQRVVGSGKWAKTFIRIARRNKWILLSATPGDSWMDYISVFIANGFYANRTQFLQRHVVFDPYVTFPKVREYLDVPRLISLRNYILVQMPFDKPASRIHKYVECGYDKEAFDVAYKDRWNAEDDRPIENASELCQIMRRVCASSEDRVRKLKELLAKHPKAIIFYNYNYELDILRKLDCVQAEWNGQKHQTIPEGNSWIYLVQYTAGAEGWNCVETDTIIFFSENYSYKIMEQACGRIDRLNTPFKNLYYYHMRTDSPIDKAIQKCLSTKKEFNEKAFLLEG